MSKAPPRCAQVLRPTGKLNRAFTIVGMILVPLLIYSGDAISKDAPPTTPRVQVEVFRGGFASVNSYIFSNGHALVVLDVQRKEVEARKLAEVIRAKHLPLAYVLISHGHTDHFTGMAYFHRWFPQARILVASEDIRRDIKAYAIYMDHGGATGSEPALDPSLRPHTAANPDGFDYEHTIEIVRGGRLTIPGGGTLELTADYPPTEAPHMTTVYCRDLNALFVADLGYNHVHAWLGDDITTERIVAWREQLVKLGARYRKQDPRIYPGHGEPTDMSLISQMTGYIDTFLQITTNAASRSEAAAEMQRRYPGYEQADFFLKYSIENHVPADTDDQWLLMVRTINTNAAREADFNAWYEQVDVPDVLKVPGFLRALRAREIDPQEAIAARATAGARYVALYDITSSAIDKTIIDMLMATWKMITVGRDTPLLKVEERAYYRRFSQPFEPVSHPPAGDFRYMALERFGLASGADEASLRTWYERISREEATRSRGIRRVSYYDLYRVLMFEPRDAPRYLTIYELVATSPLQAQSLARELVAEHVTRGSAVGYRPAETLLYRQVSVASRAAKDQTH
jgi:glyoxylase-like metal-dependent hydrolase (beta-lactamase superfamily II)